MSRLVALALLCLPSSVCAELWHAELRLSKPELFVNEQLVVSLTVVHGADARPRWEEPAFEGFWTERLRASGEIGSGGGPDTSRRTTVFRRALFPSRAGVLTIPASRVRTDVRGREQVLAVPAASVLVQPLPGGGRPTDFSGVVGRVRVQVSIDRDEVEIGESLPVTVSVFGEANVWDVREPPLEALLGDDLEVFPERARLVKSEHRGTLRARRVFRAEIVPRDTGHFAIPALSVPYFDPEQRRYLVASSEPVAFVARPPGHRTPRRPWDEARAAPPPLPRSALLWPALIVLTALAVSGFGLARWSRASELLLRRKSVPRPGVLLERARAARDDAHFPELLRDALKAGIHVRHGIDPSSLTTEEIAARIDDPPAVRLLESLDELRFTPRGGDPDALLGSISEYVLS